MMTRLRGLVMEFVMHASKDDLTIKLQMPGAIIRQQSGFGDVSGFAQLSGEYFTLAAGVNTEPLFKGLHGDACQCPHWGYVVKGTLTTTDLNGTRETVHTSDLFYWPPGHNVRVDEDAEIIMFSPQHEHEKVIDHMIAMTRGTPA